MTETNKISVEDVCKGLAVALTCFTLTFAYLQLTGLRYPCVPVLIGEGDPTVHHQVTTPSGAVIYPRADRCPKCKGEY